MTMQYGAKFDEGVRGEKDKIEFDSSGKYGFD